MTEHEYASPTGLVVLHSNRQEMLKQVLIEWMKQHPLPPLESETLLVQSNGIGQWLKFELARDPDAGGAGIAANIDLKLPAMFLWQMYRAVLGPNAVPKRSAYDKAPLTWRLMRVLQSLPDQPEFQPLHAFLQEEDSPLRRYQLAGRLADLYDQYQIYRDDWLLAWSQGSNQITNARQEAVELSAEHRWQAQLWRLIRDDLKQQAGTSRADLHVEFLEALKGAAPGSFKLPRRVILFGVSALPSQILEALSALSEHMQVLLCVLNPCRYYWGDLVEGRELLKQVRHRQRRKPELPEVIDDQSLHLYTQPLLAAWGKQGRDYLNLLEAIDQTEQHADRFELARVDLFDANSTPPDTLLQQIQWQILELVPNSPESVMHWDSSDASVRFTGAHSAQREVEILHDQLLAAFQADPSLVPQDILVMVPDINDYRAHIEAVFSLVDPQDLRFIPFSISDQSAKARVPLLGALEFLLNLKTSRLLISDLLDLIELPAIQQRFGFNPGSLPLLATWIREAGVRWGLSGQHRAQFGLQPQMNQNDWLSGLSRMLLGYAIGSDDAYESIEPLGDVAGLEAESVGALGELLHQLNLWLEQITAALDIPSWHERCLDLLERFFDPQTPEETQILPLLERKLAEVVQQAVEAEVTEAVDIEILARPWLESVEQPDLSQRFMSGGVTFATLMPMRAIPYHRIYLLGMNDGVYPRSQAASDYDLMALPGCFRPGDRSRREDDRYLFLEALLSARDHLSISWIAHSERDNSEQPPSVLVAQLIDHINQGWTSDSGRSVVESLLQHHPLQPFSPDYFRPSGPLFTYAREWRDIHTEPDDRTNGDPDVLVESTAAVTDQLAEEITAKELSRLLRRPVAYFYQQRLGVRFLMPDEIPPEHEPFELSGLDRYRLGAELLEVALGADESERDTEVQRALQRIRQRGELPWGALAEVASRRLTSGLYSTLRHHQWSTGSAQPLIDNPVVRTQLGGTTVVGTLDHLHPSDSMIRACVSPSALVVDKQPRCDKLIEHWPLHLLGCIEYPGFTTRLSGPDKILQIDTLDADTARERLNELLSLRQSALHKPIPLVAKTGIKLLQFDISKARSEFEGDNSRDGEQASHDELRGHWSRFDALIADGMEAWAEQAYGALIQHTRIWQREDTDGQD